MLTHDYPFSFCQWSWLVQDMVRHGYFSNVMQERTASNIDQFGFWHSHQARKFHSEQRHAPGMIRGFAVAQI